MNNESILDILKKAMGQYGGTYDDSMYTPEGGRSKLGMARKYGIEPESMAIDTLSFLNPANYMFKITGKNVETGGKVEGTTRATGSLPLKADVESLIGEFYKDRPFEKMDAMLGLREALKSAGKSSSPKPSMEDLMRKKMMESLGIESDEEYDAFLRFKEMMKNR